MDKLFKQLVDSTKPTTDTSLREDLKSLYERYQLNIDILVEASDNLIFFEVKRKPLTRGAKSVKNSALLIDLLQSLLASQIQINKHEIFIIKKGCISLKNGCYIYQLNGRNIAQVSVSLLDFGGFQDKIMIFDFLTNILSAKLKVDGSENLSTEENEKLDDLKKTLSTFQSKFNELVQLDPTKKGQPLHDSWFLSLPQLLIILDNVKSSDDLKRELWKTRNSSAGFLDFYQEIIVMMSKNFLNDNKKQQ
ncbi:MAG: hypothetical protein VKL42_02520 [Snowella sp.]|nr:hypothetical protein [Snowella sp.]